VSAKAFRDGFMPWAGLALGTAGYFLVHQVGSDSTFQDCRVGSPLVVLLAALVGLTIVALGAFGSFRVFRSQDEGPSRRLVAVVSLLASALFVIAILLPVIASLIIPRCWA
jgi:hypothetical protein